MLNPLFLGRIPILVIFAACALIAPTAAQPQQPREGSVQPNPIVFSSEPFEIKSLGLTIRLPIGARLDTSSIGVTNASFALFAKDNTWIIKLLTPESHDLSLTAANVADGLLAELSRSWTARDPLTNRVTMSAITELFRDDSLVLGTMRASRFYARVPRPNGAVLVNGYTIIRTAPGRFVIFQLDCMEAEYDRARMAYETILATVRFRDPTEMSADRASGLLAGDRLLMHFNSDDLVSMLPESQQFYRLYRPGTTGLESDDIEVAYQVVDIHRGQRGELTPSRSKSRWIQSDRDWGFVVNVKARFLDGKQVIDSESIFFLSLDRTKEAWSTKMAIKQGRKTALFIETGARDGDAIEVNTIRPGEPPQAKRWKKPPLGYLSQVEKYLLPMMLTAMGAQTEFAFYTYQSQHNDLMLRRDTLTLSDTTGQWILDTTDNEDVSKDTTFLSANGDVVRKKLANGVVMEAIKPDRLARIWRNKGLPTE